jgi:hypothetical protein
VRIASVLVHAESINEEYSQKEYFKHLQAEIE